MANYSVRKLNSLLSICQNGANSNQVRGRAFEDLACYLFDKIPGVSITQRNQFNAFQNEEIDVAIWNEKSKKGLNFLPNLVLIECKNWSNPVSSIEVNWFCTKLRNRGLDYGVLIANNGITGNGADLTAAHSIVAQNLAEKRRLIVITTAEINALRNTDQFIKLIKLKLCTLAASGTIN